MEKDSFSSSRRSDVSLDFEAELTLSDKLKVFKATNFNPDSYVVNRCRAMSEKIDSNMVILPIGNKAFVHIPYRLEKAYAEEILTSVYANYASFIRISREISDLEGELVSLKNLLASRANIIHGIADGVRVECLNDGIDKLGKDDTVNIEDKELMKYDKWLAEFVKNLEVLLAERRVDKALETLDIGESVVDEARDRRLLNPSALMSLQNSIMEQRQKLADQLAAAVCQPITSGFELRSTYNL